MQENDTSGSTESSSFMEEYLFPIACGLNVFYIGCVIALVHYFHWLSWKDIGIYVVLGAINLILGLVYLMVRRQYGTTEKKQERVLTAKECDALIIKKMWADKDTKVRKGIGIDSFEMEGYYGRSPQNKSPIYQAYYVDTVKETVYWAAVRQDTGKTAIHPRRGLTLDQRQQMIDALTDDPMVMAIEEQQTQDALGNRITTRKKNPYDVPKELPAIE